MCFGWTSKALNLLYSSNSWLFLYSLYALFLLLEGNVYSVLVQSEGSLLLILKYSVLLICFSSFIRLFSLYLPISMHSMVLIFFEKLVLIEDDSTISNATIKSICSLYVLSSLEWYQRLLMTWNWLCRQSKEVKKRYYTTFWLQELKEVCLL